MFKYLLSSFSLLLLIANAHAEAPMKDRCPSKDADEIIDTVKHYLDKNTPIHSTDVSVIKLHCVDTYAYAIVHPTKPVTDEAIAYLQKGKDGWSVLNLGTDFEPEFLNKLPEDLRHPS